MGTLPPGLPEKQPPCFECGGYWSVGGQCAACAYGDLLGRPADDPARRERLLATHCAHSAGHWFLAYHGPQNLDPPAPGYGVERLAVRAAWWSNPGLLAVGGAFLREMRDHQRWSVVPPLGIPGFGPWVAVRWRVWWQGEPGFLQFTRQPGEKPNQSLHGGFGPARLNGAVTVLRRVARLARERGRPKGYRKGKRASAANIWRWWQSWSDVDEDPTLKDFANWLRVRSTTTALNRLKDAEQTWPPTTRIERSEGNN